jgi:hypothetical protein
MRAILGTVLGLGALLVGALIPMLAMGMISVLIWGCRVVSGPQPKHDPATTFATISAIVGIPIGAWIAFCFVSLPIFAHFGVRVVSKRQRGPDKTVAMARSMKQVALRYTALMDKLIEQEKV